jgi:glycerophosphoryl diester phosphodiesterase
MNPSTSLVTVLLFFAIFLPPVGAATTVIIARDGGPVAHSQAATTLAAQSGADYLELPLTLSADGHLIIFRHLTLEHKTDVAEKFPEKRREDGSHYVIDFTLDELRRLRLAPEAASSSPELTAAITTLPEQLALVHHLETVFDRPLKLVLELRAPWFHRQQGHELSRLVLEKLRDLGYGRSHGKFIIQCFDPEELQSLYHQLLPEFGMNLPLVQLIGDNDGAETRQRSPLGPLEPYNYDWLFTNVGLKLAKTYAVALALPARRLIDPAAPGTPLPPGFVEEARRHSLQVFAVVEQDSDSGDELTTLVSRLHTSIGVDGLYSRHPAKARLLLDAAVETAGAAAPPPPETIPVEALPDAEEATPSPSPPNDLPPFFKELKLTRPSTPGLEAAPVEGQAIE